MKKILTILAILMVAMTAMAEDVTLELKDFSSPSTPSLNIGYKLGDYVYVTVVNDILNGMSYSASSLDISYKKVCTILVDAQTGARLKAVELTFASEDYAPLASGNGFDADLSTSGLVFNGNTVSYSGKIFSVNIVCDKAAGSGHMKLTGIKVTYERLWVLTPSDNLPKASSMTNGDVKLRVYFASSSTETDGVLLGNNSDIEVADLDLRGKICKNTDATREYYLHTIDATGEPAFENASALRSIIIPAGVELMEGNSFYGCTNLESVTFEEGSKLLNVGFFVFKNCPKLKSIEFPPTLETIGGRTFTGSPTDVTFNSVPALAFFDHLETGGKVIEKLTDKSCVCTNSTYADYLLKPNTISYTRQMANQWGTIVLPFDVTISESDPYDFYSLSSVTGGTLNLKKITGKLSKGTPAIIRMSEAAKSDETGKYELSISADNPTISQTITKPSAVGGLTMTGAYKQADITSKSGYIIANNSFWKIADIKGENKVYCSPFRAYLAGTIQSDAKQLTIGFSDDTPTAVETINAITTGTAEYYDLNGRKLSDLQQGVNIVKFKNGTTKKVTIK